MTYWIAVGFMACGLYLMVSAACIRVLPWLSTRQPVAFTPIEAFRHYIAPWVAVKGAFAVHIERTHDLACCEGPSPSKHHSFARAKSRNSTPRRRCGMTMLPPTISATSIASHNSSSLHPAFTH